MVDFSFDDYEVSFLISLDNFLLKVYFIGYMDDISSLFLGTICLEDLFPSFYSEIVSAFVVEVCFLYAAKCWILFEYQSVNLRLFIGELSPLILRDNKDG